MRSLGTRAESNEYGRQASGTLHLISTAAVHTASEHSRQVTPSEANRVGSVVAVAGGRAFHERMQFDENVLWVDVKQARGGVVELTFVDTTGEVTPVRRKFGRG